MLKLLTVAAVVGVAVSSSVRCGIDSCVYKGRCYMPGTVYPNQEACFKIVCEIVSTSPLTTSWVATGDIYRDCASCSVYDDPHFRTFDGKTYDFHGKCNYTLTQKLDVRSPYPATYYPEFGVFSEFKTCATDVTCLKTVIFQDSLGMVITIPFPLGGPPPHGLDPTFPVISWQHPGSPCWRYQGTDLAMEVCPGFVRIWTRRRYLYLLNGLCGLFSGPTSDDFTTRQGALELDSNTFADTWATNDQTSKICKPTTTVTKDCPDRALFERECANRRCIQQLPEPTKTEIINNCVHDACANPKNRQIWLDFHDNSACHVLNILKHTIRG